MTDRQDTRAEARYGDKLECPSCGHEMDPVVETRVMRFDRSWWHYADDCPSAPGAARQSTPVCRGKGERA